MPVDFVMVPVPEELVPAVERFLMTETLIGQAENALDRDAFVRFLPTLDERCRSILSLVVDAKLSGQELAVSEIAKKLQWSEHETVGLLYELGELILQSFGPLFVLSKTAQDGDAIDWRTRIVFVSAEVAQLIANLEQDLSTIAP